MNTTAASPHQSSPAAASPHRSTRTAAGSHREAPVAARVYKRWIFAAVVATLLFSWGVSPWILPQEHALNRLRLGGRLGGRLGIPPGSLGTLSEFLLESALFKTIIPFAGNGNISDEIFARMREIVSPLWSDGDGAPPGSSSRWSFLSSSGSSAASSSADYTIRAPANALKGLAGSNGLHAKYPVVLIPGITSTGLELWQGAPCAKKYFRQRLWGTLAMMRIMLMDSACWLAHLKLDIATGGDPPGVKLRAAQGLEAADFLMPGFWVWARIIENLAAIGYDHNNLVMAAYDWRLDMLMLEERDHYYSRLKVHIEHLVRMHGRKVAIISHSLGGNVWFYFMKWVEHTPHAADAADARTWVERHIHATISIATPFLGVPKAASVLISGEMKDTAQLGHLESLLLEMLMSKRERLSLFRSWGGGFSMLPKGGNAFWASAAIRSPPKKAADQQMQHGAVALVDAAPPPQTPLVHARNSPIRLSFDDFDSIIDTFVPKAMADRIHRNYSWKAASANAAEAEASNARPSSWVNPLEAPLPHAPSMTMYCLYGVGIETENGYEYELSAGGEHDQKWTFPTTPPPHLAESIRSGDLDTLHVAMKIRVDAIDEAEYLSNGIYHVDGDGTVPTLSNGYMCAHAWKRAAHLNPAGMRTVTREYGHAPSSGIGNIRGGPGASDHVDILGNCEMTMDILKIVSDVALPQHPSPQEGADAPPQEGGDAPPSGVEERIMSDILLMAASIDFPAAALQ